jgi:glyoxylase-like metal-dependent hydrolase (beta-lactamase superfamily II)
MAELKPGLVLPGHGRPFATVAERVEALIAHHERRFDQIVEIVGRDDMTGWQVALELWGARENLYEKRLALQEGLAHLQALAVDGRVAKSVRPGSVRWRRI